MSPWETIKHSQTDLAQSLDGLLLFPLGPDVHKVLFLPSKSLWLEWSLILTLTILWLLVCPWIWGIFFLVGSNILPRMAVQQLVAILVFSQEQMKTRPSAPPS